ncbi:MAG: sensor histidine kinase, partial [Candidatus Lokiarchaeota archaeon]|nr:sensor histidine kinase [Candidatus Lokiarchaeota archaeon]MBD3199876.1 sensor histidine kinase [Candidatus Lokiarchaeota archaeon]
KELDTIKNEFITNAAHELKTPLISISGYTDFILMKHNENLNPEMRDDLNIIKRNVYRLEKLMDQLLEVMKIDEHKLDLQKFPTNIKELLEDCIREISYQLKAKEHKIKVNVDKNLILEIDPERLYQVFTNLLSNAIKFTAKQGLIEITSKRLDNNTYQFSISDNGLGLTADELARLFKKFETIKSPIRDKINISGTGLGLYISKGIIKAHGGKIWAHSDGLNKGTTFYFTLPI